MKKDMIIRPYQGEDHAQIQRVCLETGYGLELPPKQMQDMLLTAFCNYYIEQEPEHCFAAVDGEKVVGYILCTKDSVAWAEAFLKKYCRILRKAP